jgi:hypothetical protein
MDSLATLVCHDRLPIRGIGTGRLYQWLSYFLTATYPLTLDVHHLYYVCEGGSNLADNLLPLCPNCHTEHHNGNIPTESLRAWKMLLMALNEAFDRRSVDLLLTIDKLGYIEWITGDDVPTYAALVASDLISIERRYVDAGLQHFRNLFGVRITDKGSSFIEAWKKGDQRAAIGALPCVTEG